MHLSMGEVISKGQELDQRMTDAGICKTHIQAFAFMLGQLSIALGGYDKIDQWVSEYCAMMSQMSQEDMKRIIKDNL